MRMNKLDKMTCYMYICEYFYAQLLTAYGFQWKIGFTDKGH